MAPLIRPLDRCRICQRIRVIAQRFFGLVYILELLRPYELSPGKPDKELPEKVGDIADEQLAQCQAIFDDSMARRAHIEQKAQWTFTAIAFLVPALASVLVFLIREPVFSGGASSPSLVILSVSGLLLILSFISALRGIAIRPHESLYIHSVIDEEYGGFLKYKKEFHAQGLLSCAIMNTSMNDHIAEFVKGAHNLLAFAVLGFTLGVIVTGCQMSAPTVPPSKADIVGAVSLSSNVLSELRDDFHEMLAADRAATASTENQMELLSDRVVTLEAEVNALRNQVLRASGPSPRP